MEELILNFVGRFDLPNLIAMGLIVWAVTKPIRKDIAEIKGDLKAIKEEIKDLDRRLCRIEGALSSKDCCMLKNDGQIKKAE